MPLSASFGFFSPFHYKKKLIYQLLSIITNLSFSSSFSFSPHIRESRLATYIREAALILKDNKNQK
jgi:hypothetical protein